MAAPREANTRVVYRAIAEAAATREEARVEDVYQAVLQEHSQKVNAEVATYRELMDRTEEALQTIGENVKTKERCLIALEREIKALEKKERALEVQLRVEQEKSTVEQWELTVQDLNASHHKFRTLAYELKSRHGIPPLEEALAQLKKERDTNEKVVGAIDEELEKLRKPVRARNDDRNALVQLAALALGNATKEKEVEKLTNEIKKLESQKTQLQDKANAQAKVSNKVVSSRLAPIPVPPPSMPSRLPLDKANAQAKVSNKVMSSRLVPTRACPQSMPSLLPVDIDAVLHSASSISPDTEQQNLGVTPAVQRKSVPVRNATSSLSPNLMPPPGQKLPRNTVRQGRPAACGAQPTSSAYMGGLGELFNTSPSLQSREREPTTPDTSTDSRTSPGVPRKMPRIELSPGPKKPCLRLPSHRGERAEPLPAARMASAPDYQHIPRTSTQTRATCPRATVGAALPFGQPVSTTAHRGEGSIPGPSTAQDHQQPAFGVMSPCANQLEQRPSNMLAPEHMSSRAISRDTEILASQLPTSSPASNSPGIQFLEREEASGLSQALEGGGSPMHLESSINAFEPQTQSSCGDTGFNLFGEDDDAGGNGFFNMDGTGGAMPSFPF